MQDVDGNVSDKAATEAPFLTAEQLKIIFALAVRADVKVSDIPQVWAALQPLDLAVKQGLALAVYKAE